MKMTFGNISGSRVLFLLITYCFVVGCSNRPSRIHQAEVDFDEAVAAILAESDADSSGSIDAEEAAKFPSIKKRFSAFDSNGDGSLGADELTSRLKSIFDPNVGLMSATCVVNTGGTIPVGATVKFVPEGFLRKYIPGAEGVVRRDGITVLSIDQGDLPQGSPVSKGLIRPGLYRVEITHPDQTIPEQFNSQTELGEEVSGTTVSSGPFRFNLEY